MGYEVDTCRERLMPYCKGVGLDIGFGGNPIVDSAMCVDREPSDPLRHVSEKSNPTQLIGEADNLHWFKDGVLDYVFSSHCLEDFYNIKPVLREWLRVIKPGGFLVLFLPDEQVYRSVTPDDVRNRAHQHENFSLEFVKSAVRELGYTDACFVHELWPVPNNLYSFDLVIQKPIIVTSDGTNTFEPVQVVTAPRKLNAASYENKKIVQLGRYGDIINILPIAQDLSRKLGKPIPIICKKDYSDILEGVSYAVPEFTPGHNTSAEDYDGQPGILNTHAAHPTSPRRIPYNLQAWEQVGYLDRWCDLFPVFDRRCRIREVAYVESLVTFEKPVMVVCLHGLSSAMADHTRSAIRKFIHESFGRVFQIIELNGKAHRPYDILGLLDVASIVLTIDTMLLHLATACDVPVVAMLSNHPPVFWRATATKGNVVYSTTYDKVVDKWEHVVRAVETHKRKPALPEQRVYHVVPLVKNGGTKNAQRRYAAAAESWKLFHEQGAVFVPFSDETAPRMFKMPNGRSLPYLKDALAAALAASTSNDDIICFTNADIIVTPGFYDAIRHRMGVCDYCCSFRMEFERTDGVRCGVRTKGRDMFAFRRLWLAQHFDEIPDFLIGMGGWDYALSMWFRVLSGRAPESSDPALCLPDVEMEYGFIWHERHEAAWYVGSDTVYTKAADHNRRLLKEFFNKIGLEEAHQDIK